MGYFFKVLFRFAFCFSMNLKRLLSFPLQQYFIAILQNLSKMSTFVGCGC